MKKKIGNYMVILVLLAAACAPSDLEQKKAELKKHKKKVVELNAKIDQLENEIASLDPSFAKANREATLITTHKVTKGTFKHYIEVSGSVESRRNISVSSETMGSAENIYITEGDQVRKGQILIKLDDEVLKNTIKELETSLELAQTVYKRQKNLWDKNIGTEIQYLEAKNQVESLESRLATTRSQLDKTTLRAPFNGSVDKVFIKEGEMAQPGVPLARIVSLQDMYIEADLSETYIGMFEKGQPVEINFPTQGASFSSNISAVGRVIDKNNRTFSVEVALPPIDFMIKPNMVAILKMQDFMAEDAVIVPTNLIQMDKQGEYIYVVQNSDSLNIAKKIKISRGKTYKNLTMVESGLSGNEVLVDKGFREVADGHVVKEVQENTI